MRLADRLKEALDLGHRQSPILLTGDPLDPIDPVDAHLVGTTPAAVLVAVVDRSEPGVILTVRPESMRRHPGQIAFPGGRVDPGDEGPVGAALREAWEEIRLPQEQVEVIGLADRYRTVTGFEITPVLAVIPPDLPLEPDPGEVAGIFEAPLHYLLEPDHQLIQTVQWRGRERRFYQIEWEGRRIWGATAAMIVNLGRRLALTA